MFSNLISIRKRLEMKTSRLNNFLKKLLVHIGLGTPIKERSNLTERSGFLKDLANDYNGMSVVLKKKNKVGFIRFAGIISLGLDNEDR